MFRGRFLHIADVDAAPMKPRPRVLAMLVAALIAAPCLAQTAPPSPPLPPRRPQALAAPVAPAQPSAPAPTTEAAPTPERVLTREQMRLCSQEWRKMKKAGKAVGWIWRDFAQSCAAAHDGG
jgi:hypothetical protein